MFKIAIVDLDLKPKEFWSLSWFEWSVYMLKFKEKHEAENTKQEEEWDRTRKLWVAIMGQYKKRGGGDFVETDLIRLSFDKEAEVPKPTLETFEKLVSKHGRERKKKHVNK